jgi:hypothetical protein
MTSRKKKRDKSTKSYLPFLKEKAPEISSDQMPPTWYENMGQGLKDLKAKTEAEHELMELLQQATPEIQRLMMIELLSAAPLPSPTAASSASQQ